MNRLDRIGWILALSLVVTVPQGRIDYRPSGIGSVTKSIYIIGESAK